MIEVLESKQIMREDDINNLDHVVNVSLLSDSDLKILKLYESDLEYFDDEILKAIKIYNDLSKRREKTLRYMQEIINATSSN